jgi:hypothetical protein
LFVLEKHAPTAADQVANTAAIDTAYGTIDTVRYIIAKPGDKINAWITVAGSVSAGGFMESAGSLGALRAVAGTTPPERIVAQAVSLVDNAAGAAKARCIVEVV